MGLQERLAGNKHWENAQLLGDLQTISHNISKEIAVPDFVGLVVS
jgi:hypothetical protein